MNSIFLLHNRPVTGERPERHTPGFDDPYAVTRKALERWENEGGKVPELAAIKESTHPPPQNR